MTETFVGTAEEITREKNRIVLGTIEKDGNTVLVVSEPKNGMAPLCTSIRVDLEEIEREKERKKLVKDVIKEIRSNTGKTIISNPKVGRNQPCPCGSGEKFKKCCRKKLEELGIK